MLRKSKRERDRGRERERREFREFSMRENEEEGKTFVSKNNNNEEEEEELLISTSTKTDRERKRKRYNLFCHSIAFMILFSAFQTASEYSQPILLELGYGNLGFISTAVIYFTLSLSNLVSPTVVNQLKPVRSMIFGSLLYLFYLTSFLFPFAPTIILSSALLGFGAAVLWTAQGVFLSSNSDESHRGRDSGIFWAFLQFRLVVGNMIALSTMSGKRTVDVSTAKTFFACMLALGAFSVLFFLALKGESKKTPSHHRHHSSVFSVIENMRRLFMTRDMKLLCIASAYSGLILTFWSGKYFTILSGHIEPETNIDLPSSFTPSLVAIGGICVALGEVVGGLVCGRVADSMGRTFVAMATFVVHFVAMGTIAYVVYTTLENEVSNSLSLFAGLLLGLGDSGISTLMYALVGEKYPGSNDESTSGFAAVKLAQSLAASVAFLYSAHLPLYVQICILLFSLSCGVYSVIRLDRNPTATSSNNDDVDEHSVL